MDAGNRGRESGAPKATANAAKPPRPGRTPGGRCAMKFLTPQTLAAAIIGRGGLVIREIERTTQAMLGVSKAHEIYPKSESRVLTATAETEAALDEVIQHVVEKVAEVAARFPAEAGADGNQLKLGVLLPKVVVTSLVGEDSEGLKQLCETSGVLIRIREPVGGSGPDASQEVQLKGAARAVEALLKDFNRGIQVVNGETWFHAWASSPTGAPPVVDTYSAVEAARSHLQDGVCAVDGRILLAMKVLIPQALANAAGSSGSALAELEQGCQATVRLSAVGDVFPRTESRVLTVLAEKKESLDKVAMKLVALLHKVADDEPTDAVSWYGHLKLSVLLPKAGAAGLIGRGGSVIKQLIDASGCHVKVRDDRIGSGPDATQKVDIRGTAEGLEQVLMEVNTQIQALKDEPWFSAWASTPVAVAVARAQLGEHFRWAAPVSAAAEAGMEMVGRTMEGLPTYVVEESRGFAMTCVVPVQLVGPLMGRGGAGLNEVQNSTKTRIVMREIPGDNENRSMTIAGPLLNTCSAYMLMMKRYLDAEKEIMSR